MKKAKLGAVGEVSRLILGGGGIGQGWGETSRDEAKATILLALESGIDVLDTAPLYRNCEAIIGETFGGKLPKGVKVTSKCRLGSPPAEEVESTLVQSLEASLAAMKLDFIDVFFLHTNICEDNYVYQRRPENQHLYATTWSLYAERFIPTMEKLKALGKIGHWGITGSGVPKTILRALRGEKRPAVVQAIANLLDSAGGLRNYAESARPRDIIAAAKENGVGVLGIRAVQAGALTRRIDRDMSPNHPETRDFDRAAPFRALCEQWGEDPAAVAHRYALGMEGVDALILGVKNREELKQCVDAEARGALEPERVAKIDALGLRT
ncbi:MAG: aldo/keto reductase [Proteobacteria bacterium]|nr:aldo/keto reductase [Pseudomonadota bacterium]